MPWGLKRYYGGGGLHFITWSCYRPSAESPVLVRASLCLRYRGRAALPGPRKRIESGPASAAVAVFRDCVKRPSAGAKAHLSGNTERGC